MPCPNKFSIGWTCASSLEPKITKTEDTDFGMFCLINSFDIRKFNESWVGVVVESVLGIVEGP